VPITDPLYGFTNAIVQGAPDNAGLYALWQDGELIYVGRAVSIRERLVEHLRRRVCPCTEQATHYSWELSLRPATREVEFLEVYKTRHGRLPLCNEEAA
jgi:excinuclease UvrABC nuclease subunit